MSTLHAHAKPGDTIEITYNGIQWFEKKFVVIERPKGVIGCYLKGDVWCSLPDGSTRMFAACQYKVVSRSQVEWAKPGDTIEVTFPDSEWFGKEFVAIERPHDAKKGTIQGDSWFIAEGGQQFVRGCDYKIVHKMVDHGHGDELSVDESLAKQRDDNLRSAFV